MCHQLTVCGSVGPKKLVSCHLATRRLATKINLATNQLATKQSHLATKHSMK